VGWNDFRLPVVGSTWPNDDGSSRQDELAICRPGEAITLQRQPENPHDPRAVAILSARGVCVGYLSRTNAGWVGSKIDRGYDVRAIVERIKGAHLDGAQLGLVLLLNMDGDDPLLDGEGCQPFDPDTMAA
jgi:hypothetical protein